ncbi:PEP-CTERM sorting domain-containing protein [Parahaliea aestuarii]|uniref:PEP-CTERM sorting domain-containing protein n=1 Tax=Parahaliea aestuarii TaxID=1852021 RepID=A0A5C9A1L8_9GAMM|nr:PEP-CTERM sorting domain-containing protein [Parahaliea aestuarii]TXS94765.1 PEP-CTERM sorting domain-containing protein [Parahaliea aestuarii]
MPIKTLKALSAAALMGLASMANANLIENGDFEAAPTGSPSPSGPNWGVYQTLPGEWETYSGAGIELQTNAVVTAHSGSNYVELDSHSNGGGSTNSVMYQTLTDLIIGNFYDLSFWYRPRTNNGSNDNGIDVLWTGDTSNFLSPLSIANQVSSDYNDWVEYTAILEATNATMYLGFAATGLDNTLGGFIDTVSLTDRPVPTPGSSALLGLGLVGLYFARRRKQH